MDGTKGEHVSVHTEKTDQAKPNKKFGLVTIDIGSVFGWASIEFYEGELILVWIRTKPNPATKVTHVYQKPWNLKW